jgi:hypothetical protein
VIVPATASRFLRHIQSVRLIPHMLLKTLIFVVGER